MVLLPRDLSQKLRSDKPSRLALTIFWYSSHMKNAERIQEIGAMKRGNGLCYGGVYAAFNFRIKMGEDQVMVIALGFEKPRSFFREGREQGV